MRQYSIFISHSWAYSDAYEKLIKMLEKSQYFNFRDYSVPKNDPIHNAVNEFQLRAAIKRQMQYASVVVIMAGVYSTYSKWINIEVNLAQHGFTAKKPILAIKPWASTRVSTTVSKAADKMVGWNSQSIANSIKELAL